MYSDSLGVEDVGSDGDPSINVRDSHIRTLNNVMISHEKKSFEISREHTMSPHKHNDDSEEDDASGVDYHARKKYRAHNAISEEDEDDGSSNYSHENQQSIEESEYSGEVYNIDGPVQLVKVSEDLQSFEVCEEGLKVLKSIKGDIGVVSLAGAQRTGKSFALNMLLDRLGGKGFKVSASTES